jgi:hypothetical protein
VKTLGSLRLVHWVKVNAPNETMYE